MRSTSRMLFALFCGVVALRSAVVRAEPPPVEMPPLAGGNASTDTDDALPPPLKFYKGREIAPFMTYHGANWLVRKERESEEHCTALLKALRLKQGQSVCDLGCGNGFYTLKLARLVGKQGKVFAVDIQPEMLTLLEQTAKSKKVHNIQPVLGTVVDPQLPDESLDLILLVDVYHEFSHPEHMLQTMRKSLKPSGRIALAEFRLEDPAVPIKLLHKMSKEQILKEFEPNGYRLADQYDELPWQHLMFFQRDDAPKDSEKQ